jgi:hypothetical protein
MDEKGYIVTEEVWEEVEDETPPPVGDAGSAAAAPVNKSKPAADKLKAAAKPAAKKAAPAPAKAQVETLKGQLSIEILYELTIVLTFENL